MESFDENTVTWSNYTSSKGALLDKNCELFYDTWELFNVTSAVKKMTDGSMVNNGFLIDFDEYYCQNSAEYASSEHSKIEWRPMLTITYTSSSDYVLSPNGREEFTTGDDMLIIWTSEKSSNADIKLLNGNDEMIIASVPISSGEYTWNINDDVMDGNDYKISISNSNGSLFDESDGTFSIKQFDSSHILIPQKNIVSVKPTSTKIF